MNFFVNFFVTFPVLIILFVTPSVAVAENEKTEPVVPVGVGGNIPVVESTARRVKVSVSPSYVLVLKNNLTLSGIGLGGGFSYSLTRKWAVGATFRQALSTDTSLTPLVIMFDARASFAITGSQILERETILVGDIPVVERHESTQSSLQVEAFIAQYLFQSSLTLVGVSGLGGALRYEIPSSGFLGISSSNISYYFMLEIANVKNSAALFKTRQFATGVVFWL